MALLFLAIPVLCIFLLNLPGCTTGGKLAPWTVGAVCLLQAVMAATVSLPFWQTVNDALALPVPVPLHIDAMSAVMLFTIALVAAVSNIVGLNGNLRRRQFFVLFCRFLRNFRSSDCLWI